VTEKLRAVIVEEDDVIAGMICYFLELQDIACSAVPTAEEGLDLVVSGHPDMAVVDVSLPRRDGWWMLRALRAREGVPQLPVVLLTGASAEEVSEPAAELACACLRKPFSYDQLNEGLSAARRRAGSPDGGGTA
jgi:DNA-binding response OmpR family regulator